MTTTLEQSRAASLVSRIESRADDIVAVLSDIASLESIRTEIVDAVKLLRTAEIEEPNFFAAKPTTHVRVYLPANNLLYSLALFVLLPALYLNDVMARPSARRKSQYFGLMDILGAATPPTARLVDYTQRQFAELSAGAVVVFNGRPDNGRRLSGLLSKSTMLGFGAGPNPALVGAECVDIVGVANRIMAARLYNNGEDCLCPDLVFVHAARREELVSALIAAAERLPATADRLSPGLVNGPLSGIDARSLVAEQLSATRGTQVWRGESVDHPCHHPVVLVSRTFDELCCGVSEYFGPVLDIVSYRNSRDVVDYLHTPERLADGMYIWGYGEAIVESSAKVGTARNIGSLTPFEAESGHEPFGGWGPRSSWVMRDGGAPVGRPLLLSAELARIARLP